MTGETPVLRNTIPVMPHITYPPDGIIIAIDPDIPEERQMVFFEAETSNINFGWILNNEKIGNMNTIPWTPKQGRYRLSLVDERNRIADSVEFEVR